jgi:hypothetical protein
VRMSIGNSSQIPLTIRVHDTGGPRPSGVHPLVRTDCDVLQ